MLGLKHTWVAVYSNKSALVESSCWLLDSVPSPTEGLRAPGQPEVTPETPETHNRTKLYINKLTVLFQVWASLIAGILYGQLTRLSLPARVWLRETICTRPSPDFSLASFPGPTQLSVAIIPHCKRRKAGRGLGTRLIFLHSCEIKSGSSLGTRLLLHS